MSASLNLGLRLVKKFGQQIISAEVAVGVQVEFSSCGRPRIRPDKSSGKVSLPLTSEPGAEVVDPSKKGQPTSRSS